MHWGGKLPTYSFPPFVDASCRREPDFEHASPSISALCRAGIFAPQLKEAEIIVYVTVKGKYHPYSEKHHRLVAILQVEKIYQTHQAGQIGYMNLNLSTPSNCMVDGNSPLNFDKTAGNYKLIRDLSIYLNRSDEQKEIIGERLVQLWDNKYLERSRKWSCFIQTKKLYCNLVDPVPIFGKDFKVPNTFQPKIISEQQLKALGSIAGLNIILGSA